MTKKTQYVAVYVGVRIIATGEMIEGTALSEGCLYDIGALPGPYAGRIDSGELIVIQPDDNNHRFFVIPASAAIEVWSIERGNPREFDEDVDVLAGVGGAKP